MHFIYIRYFYNNTFNSLKTNDLVRHSAINVVSLSTICTKYLLRRHYKNCNVVFRAVFCIANRGQFLQVDFSLCSIVLRHRLAKRMRVSLD